MPVYDYKCNDCQKTFSIILPISEYMKSKQPLCKHCNSKNVKRIYSGVTVITSKKS
ncbi:MAG: FmdB family zinc ribbon protein [Promethearchaeota archaeon]